MYTDGTSILSESESDLQAMLDDFYEYCSLAKKRLVNKAVVSMYEVLKSVRKHNLSIKCLFGLFDKMVKPILLYGCGIWGLRNGSFNLYQHFKIYI